MPFLFNRLYRRLGRYYIVLFGLFDAASALLVCAATVGMFSLYTDMSTSDFWEALAFSSACALLAVGYTAVKGLKLARPMTDWLKRGRTEEGALEAWRTAVSLPREFIVRNGWQPFLLVALPIAVFFTIRFDLPFYSAPIIFAGTLVAVAYASVLHFFAAEQFFRPVVQDICRVLPRDFAGMPAGVPHVGNRTREQRPRLAPVRAVVVGDFAETLLVLLQAGLRAPSRIVVDPIRRVRHHQVG